MGVLRIIVSCREPGRRTRRIIHDLTVEMESSKRLTKVRVARILANALPGFRRRKGRASRLAGVDILPVLESTSGGWRAWRLSTGDDQPSGFEPSLPGRVGKLNSAGNPFADRENGVWEQANILVAAEGAD